MGERKGVRIGHEKMATHTYLRQRGVLFSFLLAWTDLPPYGKASFMSENNFRVEAQIIRYDPEVLAQLRERAGDRFQYVDFEEYLDSYIENEMGGRSLEELEADYRDFGDYYFRSNVDLVRQAVISAHLERKRDERAVGAFR